MRMRLGRKGRILKRAALTGLLLVFAAWEFSAVTGFTLVQGLSDMSMIVSLQNEVVMISLERGYSGRYSTWGINRDLLDVMGKWRPRFRTYSCPAFREWSLIIPLYLPFLVLIVLTAYLWWRDRRYPTHCCQICGYDLTGNISGVCPECGERL